MVPIRAGKLRLRSTRSIPGGVTPEPILLVSVCPTVGCPDERVRFRVTFDPDGFFSRDRGLRAVTSGALSRRTRAPTASATGAPQNAHTDDSGLMMSGSSGRSRTYNPPVNSRMLYH